MNTTQIIYLLDEVKKNKSSHNEVMKDEIYDFCVAHDLEVKKNTARATMVDTIRAHGLFETFITPYLDRFEVPIWVLADHHYLSSFQIETLTNYGVIKEEPHYKTFPGRNGKFDALVYPLSVFEYESKFLRAQYEALTLEGTFKIRLETKTPQEVQKVTEVLSRLFELRTAPKSYEHRSKNGYYTYFDVKLLPIELDEFMLNKLILEKNQLVENVIALEKRLDENVLARENKRLKDELRRADECISRLKLGIDQ